MLVAFALKSRLAGALTFAWAACGARWIPRRTKAFRTCCISSSSHQHASRARLVLAANLRHREASSKKEPLDHTIGQQRSIAVRLAAIIGH